ncbi:MAG TPA: molybdopterin cofactor-binding domain-containing protein, partial [Myxococcales bacterium]|nr:molybdopterin cofactor-binding domain-containing protein [Myxococcales bacterium]
VHGAAKISTSAPAGSMRGFGIPQVTFAIESMIDELAAELGRDPIEYRLDQLLRQGDRDASGMEVRHHLANVAACNLAREHPLWAKRREDKARLDRHGVLYGVGFACCMQAFGTTTDAACAGVELSPDGALSVCSSAVDMGQGAGEALAAATATALGAEAAEVVLGDMERFIPCLRLPPREKLANSMSASITVFLHVHAVEQACAVVFEHGILPAARVLWHLGDRELPGPPGWKGGHLVADGLDPLPLERLARVAHEKGFIAGARVHTLFQNEFATAAFKDFGVRPIDALAVARAAGDYRQVISCPLPPALQIRSRRTLYASVGHLLAVEVYRATGRVQVVDAVTVLDAGDVHHRALMEGQAHGGLAMGLGMALSEQLPSGPEFMDPDRNLHKYLVPRVTTVPPLGRLHVVTVPLETGTGSILGADELEGATPRRKKGIAEAAMTTVAPALANAIAHATGGLRLRQLPFTPDRVKEALQVPPLPAQPAPTRPPLRPQGAPDRPPLAPFALTVNGETISHDARPDDLLIDFLHQAGKTGTKYACGIGHCGACKVAVQESPGGPMIPVLSCYARLSSVQGLLVTTVEGLGSRDKLHPLQQAFLGSHAFQCGYSTPGMLMTGAILIDQIRRRPGGTVPRHLLDREITAAMANQVCRCTGYVRYFDDIKKVILGWPTKLVEGSPPALAPEELPASIWFRVMKRSRNDDRLKMLEGRFESPAATLHFHKPMTWDDCTGEVTVPLVNLFTKEPARDLNLRRFLFGPVRSAALRFTLDRAEPLESYVPGEALPLGFTLPLRMHGAIHVGRVPVNGVTADVALTVMSETRMLARSRRPFRLELSRLGLPLDLFMREFGLRELDPEIELGIDNVPVTYKTA